MLEKPISQALGSIQGCRLGCTRRGLVIRSARSVHDLRLELLPRKVPECSQYRAGAYPRLILGWLACARVLSPVPSARLEPHPCRHLPGLEGCLSRIRMSAAARAL